MEKEKLIGLVSKAQGGDSGAMEQLFSAFYNDIYYFALKTVKDSDTACDITQEAFLEIIRTIKELKEPAAFVTWMKQITYHQCTRYFKKKKEVLVDEDEDGNTIFDTLADESEGSIPSEVLEKEDFRNTILGIINELTEEQRSAVMMFYFDELTVAQIAQIQGVSDGTVKSRLNYARKALKKSVEDYEKKNNVKLHSFGFLPLLLLFFRKEAMPETKAAAVRAAVSTAAKGSVVGAATGAKLAAIPLAAKLLAGLVALVVVIAAIVGLTGRDPERYDTIGAEPDMPYTQCENYQGGTLNCDQDGDGKCDITGGYMCDNSHFNSHFSISDPNHCEACGALKIPEPKIDIVFNELCIQPGSRADGSYDMADCIFEVYNLDTEELLCTFDRWDFDFVRTDSGAGNLYNMGLDLYEATLKVQLFNYVEVSTNIGVRAVSLDENYADSALSAARYIHAGEWENIRIDCDYGYGRMTILNPQEESLYYLYIWEEYPILRWFTGPGEEYTMDLWELHQSDSFSHHEAGVVHHMNLYEVRLENTSPFNPKLPVAKVMRTWGGNLRNVDLCIADDIYNRLLAGEET